ncbi:MAG: glycosyltransferase family 4 protein [Bacteroidota bacterium]
MASASMKLCVQWPRFGPLHLARLRATHAHAHRQGGSIIGLETASDDAIYEWRVEEAAEPFERIQAFPREVFNEIRPSTMHARTLSVLDQINPDAVAIMSYGYPDARAALAWCRRRRRVAILMMATKEDDAERVAWREYIKRQIVQQYDSAIVGGTPQRDYVTKLGIPEAYVFTKYNAVDNAFFERGAAEARAHPERYRHLPGLADDTPFFVASNRFIARKNLDRLLLAYQRYRRLAQGLPGPLWRLLMLGDGYLRGDLEALVKRETIEGVEFCGFRQIEELPVYYGRASAFVHPSLVDQWALAVNEAMAAGLPVIVSTGAGCASDLVEEGVNGFCFEPHDVQGLAEHLLDLARPSVDRAAMGRRSREIVAGWAPERFAESMWQAAMAGRERADRRPRLAFQAALVALNRIPRHIKAFHTVEA